VRIYRALYHGRIIGKNIELFALQREKKDQEKRLADGWDWQVESI
jgi:hypothetical protein